MFDERQAVLQLLALNKEDKQIIGDATLLHLDNGITLSIRKIFGDEYSILPYADKKCRKHLVYDDVGYGIIHTISIVEEYMLRDEAWIKKHIKK